MVTNMRYVFTDADGLTDILGWDRVYPGRHHHGAELSRRRVDAWTTSAIGFRQRRHRQLHHVLHWDVLKGVTT